MAETLTSEATHKPVSDESEVLLRKLDSLFEQYLNLLDEYQKTREALAKNMSAGFMSLAQANFASQSRIRYGQDFYDERMRSLCTVAANSDQARNSFSIKRKQEQKRIHKNLNDEKHSTSEEKDSSTTCTANSQTPVEAPEEKMEKESPKVETKDPVRWFGLFASRDLRIAQGHFVRAVDEDIGRLTTIDSELFHLGIEIKRSRKRLGKLG